MRFKNYLNKSIKVKIFIILLSPIIFFVNNLLSKSPILVERYYSNSFNKLVRQGLSILSSIAPFSIAEFLFLFLVIYLVYLIVICIVKIRNEFIHRVINIGVYLSILYIAFMITWGFNYNRFPFNEVCGIEIKESTKEELEELCSELILKSNTLREKLKENSQGVMHIEGGYKWVFKEAYKGYEEASKKYKELGGKYGIPKAVLLSEKMSYTGITGIYMPYTGEANVNINIVDFMLPCTVLHEMAHQRGFAREDEANYIAYLTGTFHPELEFQYSGVMLALIESMNALASVDLNSYNLLKQNYSSKVIRDLRFNYEFWKKYSGKTEKISNSINNTYLKSNGQKDGVASYGKMVDLLLAERRK